jgi:hypothetical protein
VVELVEVAQRDLALLTKGLDEVGQEVRRLAGGVLLQVLADLLDGVHVATILVIGPLIFSLFAVGNDDEEVTAR